MRINMNGQGEIHGQAISHCGSWQHYSTGNDERTGMHVDVVLYCADGDGGDGRWMTEKPVINEPQY